MAVIYPELCMSLLFYWSNHAEALIQQSNSGTTPGVCTEGSLISSAKLEAWPLPLPTVRGEPADHATYRPCYCNENPHLLRHFWWISAHPTGILSKENWFRFFIFLSYFDLLYSCFKLPGKMTRIYFIIANLFIEECLLGINLHCIYYIVLTREYSLSGLLFVYAVLGKDLFC
jgi:hypothetical protein